MPDDKAWKMVLKSKKKEERKKVLFKHLKEYIEKITRPD